MNEQACGIDGCALAEQVREYLDLVQEIKAACYVMAPDWEREMLWEKSEEARRALRFVVSAHDPHGALSEAQS